MPVTRIGFLVQNETHADNAALLAQEMATRHPELRPVAFTFEGLFHQNVASRLVGVPVKEFPVGSRIAFYHLGPFARARIVLTISKQLRAIAREVDAIIAGNDGAIQRVVLAEARRLGIPTVLLIDGILYPSPEAIGARMRFEATRLSARVLTHLGIAHLGPSIVGHFPVTASFVMHDLVRSALESQRTANSVRTVQMPRQAQLRQQVTSLREIRLASAKRRVLYATSAFRWHGHNEQARLQEEEVKLLVDLTTQHNHVELRFRVHPREAVDFYEHATKNTECSLSTVKTPLADDLAWCDAVITPRSTMALEAIQLGIPAFVSTLVFPPPPSGSPISSQDIFPRLRESSDFVALGADACQTAHAKMEVPEETAYDAIIATLLSQCRQSLSE